MLTRLKELLGRRRPATEPNLPAISTPEPLRGENLLLISDLHLGEACKEHSRIEYLKRSAEIDADICAFLEHHTRDRLGGLPWRLILGGDLIDFLQVTISPRGATRHERAFGLGSREEESAWKLSRLMERHRGFFVYLADFVGAGNRLEIIQGNHDEELFWPKVQAQLIEGLVRLYFGGEAYEEQTPEQFAARIHFNRWFFYQPGVLWAEHGHRFDEFCATVPQLAPLCPLQEDELVQPLSGLAIRYFANQERGFSTHDKEHWGPREYWAYFRARGWGYVLQTLRRYLVFLREVWLYWAEHGRFESERARREHDEALARIAEGGTLQAEPLRAMDELSAPNAMSRPRDLYVVTGLGELSALCFWLLFALIALVTPWGWLADVITLAVGTVLALGWIRHFRAGVTTDTPEKLEGAATRASALLEVPIVSLGHSHHPVRKRMPHDHRAFYVNTGAFLPPERPRHAADEPCCCPTTFVQIPHAGEHERPVPRLQRWCCVRSQAASFS